MSKSQRGLTEINFDCDDRAGMNFVLSVHRLDERGQKLPNAFDLIQYINGEPVAMISSTSGHSALKDYDLIRRSVDQATPNFAAITAAPGKPKPAIVRKPPTIAAPTKVAPVPEPVVPPPPPPTPVPVPEPVVVPQPPKPAPAPAVVVPPPPPPIPVPKPVAIIPAVISPQPASIATAAEGDFRALISKVGTRLDSMDDAIKKIANVVAAQKEAIVVLQHTKPESIVKEPEESIATEHPETIKTRTERRNEARAAAKKSAKTKKTVSLPYNAELKTIVAGLKGAFKAKADRGLKPTKVLKRSARTSPLS